jgi:hypothetical protein
MTGPRVAAANMADRENPLGAVCRFIGGEQSEINPDR